MQFKYEEDKILKEIENYIAGTYKQHYVGDGEVQTMDFWRSLGSLGTTARDQAIKYLARYGKKDGYNEKDLLKAVHFIVIMMKYGRDGGLDLSPQPPLNETELLAPANGWPYYDQFNPEKHTAVWDGEFTTVYDGDKIIVAYDVNGNRLETKR